MAGYLFQPLARSDLPLLRRWLAAPHVREWWGDPDRELELVEENFSLDWIDSFLVSCDGRPFAYIQCYSIFSEDYQPFPEQPPGTSCIDQFIGESDMIDIGHGSAFISEFATSVLRQGARRLVTDPDPDNKRAIAAYKKAGFFEIGLRDTPWGHVLLMARDCP